MFLYAVTMVLKRRSTLFTLQMAYMADIINYKNNESKQEEDMKREILTKQLKKKEPVIERSPGRGDGLSSARAHAAECAGTGSIWWAPAQGGRTEGKSRVSSASCRPAGTLWGEDFDGSYPERHFVLFALWKILLNRKECVSTVKTIKLKSESLNATVHFL